MKRSVNIWVVMYKMTWVLITVVLVIIAIAWSIPSYTKYKEMQLQRATKIEEKQLLEARVNHLKIKQERLATDPAFLERTARNEGMAKSNETVCKMAP